MAANVSGALIEFNGHGMTIDKILLFMEITTTTATTIITTAAYR